MQNMSPALVCRTESDENKRQLRDRVGRRGSVPLTGSLDDAVWFGCGRMNEVRERRQGAGVVS